MPRNDQVTRQWFLMQKLEQSHGATLQELAASLPEDFSCHPRTIRRDLEALEAAHIPPAYLPHSLSRAVNIQGLG